jgi:hypothetical protein
MKHVMTTRASSVGLLIWACLSLAVVRDQPHAADNTAAAPNYARPYEPLVKPALLPLPPGAVEPAGWLRDWAEAARHGITGHLDERHATFADGWKGNPIKAPGASSDGTGWPIEQSAYWLDGALRLAFVLHDQALIDQLRARLDPVVDGVNKAPFGTSFIYSWVTRYRSWRPLPPPG